MSKHGFTKLTSSEENCLQMNSGVYTHVHVYTISTSRFPIRSYGPIMRTKYITIAIHLISPEMCLCILSVNMVHFLNSTAAQPSYKCDIGSITTTFMAHLVGWRGSFGGRGGFPDTGVLTSSIVVREDLDRMGLSLDDVPL